MLNPQLRRAIPNCLMLICARFVLQLQLQLQLPDVVGGVLVTDALGDFFRWRAQSIKNYCRHSP